MKKVYGFTLTDNRGGKIIRWFSSYGNLKMPCTPELRVVFDRQKTIENFNEAFDYCRETGRLNKWKFEKLTEKDWHSTPNPVKNFLKKIFK